MDSHHISTKTGGINDVAGYYVSACCRSEVFLGDREKKPRCLECGKPTEWGMVLRRMGGPKQSQRRDSRRTARHSAPEELPRLSRIEWGGFGLNEVRVVNCSPTGVAVEVSDPAIFFGKVSLTLENGETVSGMIRYCRPNDTKFVLGIVCEVDLATMGHIHEMNGARPTC
jgi:hypothetical protein